MKVADMARNFAQWLEGAPATAPASVAAVLPADAGLASPLPSEIAPAPIAVIAEPVTSPPTPPTPEHPMKIATEIESLFQSLKARAVKFDTEIETHFTAFIASAKTEEAAAEAKIASEVAHLESLGFGVTKPAEAVVAQVVIAAPVPAAAPVAPAPAIVLDAAAAAPAAAPAVVVLADPSAM